MSENRFKQLACAAIDANREELIGIAAQLHAHPEIAFQEFEAATL
ncbi:MAG: M20 family metallopeptidase, partial [Anaerolineaceae bacterium]|nr:M20 family metallopeptidase [Anaerolineaceae bacterium]